MVVMFMCIIIFNSVAVVTTLTPVTVVITQFDNIWSKVKAMSHAHAVQ